MGGVVCYLKKTINNLGADSLCEEVKLIIGDKVSNLWYLYLIVVGTCYGELLE